MKKRIFAALLCLAMVLTMLPVGVTAQGETAVPQSSCVHESEGWTQWSGSNLPTSGKLCLTEDVQLTATVTLNDPSHELSICLNGYAIIAKSGARAFRVSNGAVLSIYDCSGDQGMVTGGGGSNGAAVCVVKEGSDTKGGTFNLYGGQLTGNRSTGAAGAVYVSTSGTVSSDDERASFNLYGGKLHNNTASGDGGAVYVLGSVFNMSGGEISENTGGAAGGGVTAGTNAVVHITGGKICGNTAKNGGGMIIQGSNPRVLVKDVQITDNYGSANAGGIYVGYNAAATTTRALTLSGAVNITNNKGGAGKIDGNVQLMSDVRVIYEDALDPAARIGIRKNSGNQIVAGGATAQTVQCYISDAPNKIFLLSGDKLSIGEKPQDMTEHADTAEYSACGHKASEAPVTYQPWYSADSLPVDEGYYYLTCDVTLPESTNKLGIYYDKGQQVVICLNGQNITRNGNGRFFRITNGSCVTICDCTAHYENITTDQLTESVYNAGRIYGGNYAEGAVAWTRKEANDTAAGSFVLYDGIITENTAASGNASGIISVVNGSFTMYGGAITGNNSASGMVDVWGTDAGFIMNGGSIGGAVCAADGQSKLTGNAGRGVLVNNGSMTMTGGSVSYNESTTYGAGVRVNNTGVFTMTGGELSWNIAKGDAYGGGLAMMGKGSTATLSGVAIRENTAHTGGGVHIQSGAIVTLNGAMISGNNTTTGDGGGVYCVGATFRMEDGLVNSNTAATSGGGIVAGTNSVVELTGGTVRGNLAKNGAGIIVQGSNPTVLLKDVNIIYNVASAHAGGVYVGYNVANTTTQAVTLSGKVNITENMCGDLRANLQLMSADRVVYQDALDPAAKIAVRKNTGDEVIRAGATDDTLSCYICDTPGRELEKREGSLFIVTSADARHDPHAKDECGHEEVTWTEWSNETALPTTSGHYYLIVDVTIRGAWEPKAGEEVTLCLNGHSIRQEKEGHRVIRLAGATLNLCDCSASEQAGEYVSGVITGGNTGESAGAGCIMVTGGAVLRLYDGTIAGNTTEGGGTIVVGSGCTMEMHGGQISENTSGGVGGGVYAGGEFTMTGGRICKNISGARGAGVYIVKGTMTMTGGEISGNEGTSYTGISVVGGTLLMKGGEVKNNIASAGGGGIGAMNREEGEKLIKPTVTIAGGVISGNIAGSDGAGVRIDGGEFIMTGGEISGNKGANKDVSCGGLRLNCDKATISGGKITKNVAANAGGVLAMCDITMTGGEISGNKATGVGAGLYLKSAKLTMTGGTISNNSSDGDAGGLYANESTVVLDGGKINGNSAKKIAAGVLITKNSKLYFKNGSISNNTAGNSAGGLMVQVDSYAEMSGGTVSNNTTGGPGGGIYVNRVNMVITGGTVTGNTSTKSGGGIYVGAESTLKFSGCQVIRNHATTQGGGMAVLAPTTISGGKIDRNTSVKEGAGIYISDTVLTMTGGSVDGNATEYNGGGICVRGVKGVMQLQGGSVSNNTCTESGGGILIQGNGKLVMTGGSVNNNYAPTTGGGVRGHNCPIEIYGGQINGNGANLQGAGIYSNLSLILKNAEVCNNTIVRGEKTGNGQMAGAGIRAHNESSLEMENVKLNGNSCEGRAGGIDVAYHVFAKITDCEIRNNFAKEKGGAFSIYREAAAYLTNCVVSGNSSDGNGGAVSMDAYGDLTMTDCTVENNSAESGAAVYQNTKADSVFTGCTITGNTANSGPSVIWAHGSVSIFDTAITGNKTVSGGATIYLDCSGADGESYLPSVNEFGGDVRICDNEGGELVLANQAFISIHGDGLRGDAKILLSLDGELTRWVVGPYNFEQSGSQYILTPGEASLKASNNAPEKTPEQQEQTTEPTASTEPGEEKKDSAMLTGLIAIVIALVAACVAVVVISLRKKKQS